jgi:multidrug efflux pump subunit AcrB
MGVVVIIALAFSIIESQLILPAHLAHRSAERKPGSGGLLDRWLALQDRVSGGMQILASRYYEPAVHRALEWRYLTLAIAIGILLITLALFASGRIIFQFFPAVQGTRLYATLEMPQGTPLEVTERAVLRLEQSAQSLREELDRELAADAPSMVNHVFASLGAFIAKGSIGSSGEGGSHLAEVSIELNLPRDYAGVPTSSYARRWRELTGPIPDAVELSFTADAFSAGSAIDIELQGKNFDELRTAAAELRAALQDYAGVLDITDTFRTGKQEVQLSLLPEARPLGLTVEDLGRQVRQAFYGYEAQRIQRRKDDVRVMVRYPREERESLGNLEEMRIRNAEGVEVPFSSVARAELARGFTSIKRVDGERVVRVVADVNRQVTTPEKVLEELARGELKEILQRHPGVNYQLAGEAEERAEAMGGLLSTAALALLLVYALLAIPLQSYLQPLVIMSVIPFGMVGAILGHLVMGKDLVFFSLLGIVALSGVVVNSSLVLVDYINKQRHSGQSLIWIVGHAGSVRFRPIVLTSLTTFVGLTPIMLDTTISTSMFVPMAVSLAFGVLVGTLITLFVVPSLYLILEDLLSLRRAGDGGRDSLVAGVETGEGT